MRYLSRLYTNLGLSKTNGIVEVKENESWEKDISSEAKFSNKIISQINIIKPDAFYHFNGVPLILFFENPEEKDRKAIHSRSWCFNQAPVIFIEYEDHTEVYDAFRFKENTLNELAINKQEILEHFSFIELQSGSTWKWIEENFYKKDTRKYRVDRYLLDNIRCAIKLLEKEDLDVKIANKIILRLIFSRYLIDRGVLLDEKYIPGNISDNEKRKESFNNLILDKPKLYDFFNYLKGRFNGNLFEIHTDENKLNQKHLKLLANLFKGKDLGTGQQILFDVYDFSIIPVELISGIYESIIDKERREKNSAVYTPTFLVDYILENTIAGYLKDNDTKDCKVFDPACGSGIFLVEAYRRMVENEAVDNKISDIKLVELLENNIYGIDEDIDALNVAIFSLYIALLDYKKPKEIKRIKLPELFNKKLFKADFFNTEHKFNNIIKQVDIRFIIGNPPWGNKKYKTHSEFLKENKDIPVALNEISQTFLAHAKDFSTKDTTCAMIVTSKALYNLRAVKFKKYFFKNFYIDIFFDLSPVRRLIFEEADNPAVIIFYRCAFGADTKQNIIKHYSIKPNLYLKNFRTLVIEKSDQKQVQQKYMIEYDWMLKMLLYGTSIDFPFLKRLSEIKCTIGNTIDKNEKIVKGDGIPIGSPKEKIGLPVIERNQVEQFYTYLPLSIKKQSKIYNRNEKKRKEEKLFNGSHILLKAQTKEESDLVVSYVEECSIFRHDVFGITTEDEIDKLKLFYGILISPLYTYFQFLTSSVWGVATRPAIRLPEYLSFPLVELAKKDKFIKLVDQFIAHYRDYYSKRSPDAEELELVGEEPPSPMSLEEFREIDKMINEAYGVDEIEKDLIEYVLDVSRYLFQESRVYEKALRRVNEEEIKKYAGIFYKHFSSIYDSPGEYFQVEYFNLDYFIAMKFKIVPGKPVKGEEIIKSQETDYRNVFQAMAQKTSLYKITNDLYINKVINGFEEDFFYIIKPNELKSWHRAAAHMDLSEFIHTINKAELNQARKST